MYRLATVLCAIWCLAACVIIVARTQGGRAFDTDIQSLLPKGAVEPVIRAAIADASVAAAGHVAMLISGSDVQRVQAGAADLERGLNEANIFTSDRADGEAVGRWLFANRNALMCERDPARFDAKRIVDRATALLYTPLAPVSGDLLSRDPFLLTLQLGECLTPQGVGARRDAILVSGAVKGSAFRIDVQDKIAGVLTAWRARWSDLTLERAGAVFYAEAAARRVRREIALIGGVSAIGVGALLLVCFRRPTALIGTIATTVAAAAGSLGAALLVFPTVHVLVFVFGSALIGVTSDYALHYLATGPQTRWASPQERLRRVFRPLTVCALSTGLGFASLSLFGLPFFRQVAVFSVAGIATAWWFTLTLLPLMDRRPRDSDALARLWTKLEAPFLALRWTRNGAVGATLLAISLMVVGVARWHSLDDVRQFQPRPSDLVAEEERVRADLGFSPSPLFLLSYGSSADQAREREENALMRLPQDVAASVLATSRFDPSPARRAQNERSLRDMLFTPFLGKQIEALGLERPAPFAGDEPTELPSGIAALEGQAAGMHYLVAPIAAGVALTAPLASEGTTLVDPAARYSAAFEAFRRQGAWALAAAFLVCALIVVCLYRTPRALIMLAAPAAGAVLALLAPAAFGAPISFFSVAALFVVMGAGIDHSVFIYDSGQTDGHPKELVVFLAAVTTVLSMGLMGFSGTYPVRSFGLAVATGVTAAYLFSFLPARIARRDRRDQTSA